MLWRRPSLRLVAGRLQSLMRADDSEDLRIRACPCKTKTGHLTKKFEGSVNKSAEDKEKEVMDD